MKVPIVSRIWPFISAYAKTLLAAADAAAARSILGVSGGGSGDMTKAVYDPQDSGHISGDDGGGVLNMDGEAAGSIDTHGLSGGSTSAGGHVYTYGVGAAPGGDIDTYGGGGGISTRGTGVFELGETGSRTTVTGTATNDRAQTLPDVDGKLVVNNETPSSGRIAMFSGTPGNIIDGGINVINLLVTNSDIGSTTGVNANTQSAIAAVTSGAVADGTYTVGLGVSTNGTITVQGGIIMAIQEATP